MHELSANPPFLKVRMNNKPSYETSFFLQKCPYGPDDPSIHRSFEEDLLFEIVSHPPTQETTALAVEECVTPNRNPFSDGSAMLRRISLNGG